MDSTRSRKSQYPWVIRPTAAVAAPARARATATGRAQARPSDLAG